MNRYIDPVFKVVLYIVRKVTIKPIGRRNTTLAPGRITVTLCGIFESFLSR